MLKQAGVELRVCGQGLLGKKLEPSQVLPGVQVDLWAMTTMVNLQLRGYVRIADARRGTRVASSSIRP